MPRAQTRPGTRRPSEPRPRTPQHRRKTTDWPLERFVEREPIDRAPRLFPSYRQNLQSPEAEQRIRQFTEAHLSLMLRLLVFVAPPAQIQLHSRPFSDDGPQILM